MNEQLIRKRNYRVLLIEGCLFFTGMAFVDVNAVIPVFIFTYTKSVLLTGLATTITFAASILMQTLVGPYVKGIRNTPAYVSLVMFLSRPLPFVMIPLLFLDLSPWLTAGVFLIIYTLLCAGDGLIVIPWTDLFSRTVVPEKRGLLLGYQLLFGGMGALLAGFIVKTVLDHPRLDNDQRYAIIFGGAAVALTISAVVMTYARDLPHPIESVRPRHLEYYKKLPAYFRCHPDFIQLVVIRVLSIITYMIAPFVILFGQERLNFPPEAISTLIYIQMIGSLLGGFIWGRVSRRFGNHRVILIAQILGLLLAVCMVILSLTSLQAVPVYLLWPLVLINGINMASWPGFMNHTIDIVNEEERTIYLLISNLTTFPFTFLAFLAGIVVNQFGYRPIFIVSSLAAVAAVWLAFRLKPANAANLSQRTP